jgi:hypothetical protein
MMMFSVLLSIYRNERPAYFRQALASLVPQAGYFNEVVIVRDGPIDTALQAVIDDTRGALPIRQVSLDTNVGLARALNAGLLQCRSEWVFRFDSDDVCCDNRAAIQAEAIDSGKFDIVGGQIEECDAESLRPLCYRNVPCEGDEIRRFIKRRNPFNHMTVCFRKATITALGGYPDLLFKEDYGLWAKAIASGARVRNVPEVVVRARAGKNMIRRRGGWVYIRSDLALQHFLVRHGLKSMPEAIVDAIMRAGVFALPATLRQQIFMRFLRQ